MLPDFVDLINVTNSNNQMATGPRLRKRLTHPFGIYAIKYFSEID
jgi:hypothetical protein